MGKYWRFWSEKRVYVWLHGGPQRRHGENVFTYLRFLVFTRGCTEGLREDTEGYGENGLTYLRGLIATGIMVLWFYGFMVSR